MKNQNPWNRTWRASKSVRKQRKYRTNAPYHAKGDLMVSHLSKELRNKHKCRSLRVRKGDKVLVLRGKYKSKSGRVERVDLSRTKTYITGIEITRRDGTKSLVAFHPSKLLIQEISADRRRI